jgi:hypothetical protein
MLIQEIRQIDAVGPLSPQDFTQQLGHTSGGTQPCVLRVEKHERLDAENIGSAPRLPFSKPNRLFQFANSFRSSYSGVRRAIPSVGQENDSDVRARFNVSGDRAAAPESFIVHVRRQNQNSTASRLEDFHLLGENRRVVHKGTQTLRSPSTDYLV